MRTPSLIRLVATGSIAAGIAVLASFNRLTLQEQEQAEQAARDYGRRLLDTIRRQFDGDEPPAPTPLPI